MSNRTRSTTAAILLALALSACGDDPTETTTGTQEVAPAAMGIADDHDEVFDAGWAPQGADAAERWALARAEGCVSGPVSAVAAEACVTR